MNKYIVILFSLLISLSIKAQNVISTQGESYSNLNGGIDFTIGEVVMSTGSNGINDLTQGFHQTNWNFLGVEDFAPAIEVFIFPNPTADVLYIKTLSFKNVMYTLFDSGGKCLVQNLLSAEQTPIQVSQLAPGNYSLELIFNDVNESSLDSFNRKIFKLVKIQ